MPVTWTIDPPAIASLRSVGPNRIVQADRPSDPDIFVGENVGEGPYASAAVNSPRLIHLQQLDEAQLLEIMKLQRLTAPKKATSWGHKGTCALKFNPASTLELASLETEIRCWVANTFIGYSIILFFRL